MALKFLNKKGWHTGSLRNIENVWKAEQKHEAEQKKLEELKKQIQDEREQLEFRQLQEQAGLVPKQERLEFLYDSGLAVGRNNSEGFATLGKPVEPQQRNEPQTDLQKLASAPGALFVEEKPQSANDTWRKLHSDPLLMIRQREQEALAQIKNNPVKMEMIKKSLEEKKQRKEEKARRKAEKKKRHREKKRRSASTDTDSDTASNERKKRKRTKHTTSSDSDCDGLAGNSYDGSNKNSRYHYTEPKIEKRYDRTRCDSIKGQVLESDIGHNQAYFKYRERANEEHRGWRYDGIPRDPRTSKPYVRERQISPSHCKERQRSPSHHRESHRALLNDRERYRSPSDYGERHREKYSSDRAHSHSKSRYLDSDKREGNKNGSHEQSAVNGCHDVRDEFSDGRVAPEKSSARPHISPKPTSRSKHQAGKLSEEEKAARLREMQMDAELHDEQRWHRLKKASDAGALEAKQATAISGRNFLDATNRSVYGAEKGGSSTIEESVRRRTHYLQGSAAAVEGNAFRR